MTTSLVFETHSITEDNEAGFATGWRPGRLSAAGREQARLLGERRRDDGIAAVFTSDLGRRVGLGHSAAAMGSSATGRIPAWRSSSCANSKREQAPALLTW